ncbi:MAG: hypothetical protein CFH37_00805 [Alphaproteobacteria bacterium MarineAlpha9_Bin7]|nr:MAG: hypothetical protein CFH37_00805 [Alphaproteobacteria bacterium MarineAlpha9_Bin7]
MLLLSTALNTATPADNTDTTCIVFLDDISATGTIFEDIYLSFAMHQMEHKNLFSMAEGKPVRILDLDLIDIDMQREFLMNYCEENPGREFTDGVTLLYKQFPQAD